MTPSNVYDIQWLRDKLAPPPIDDAVATSEAVAVLAVAAGEPDDEFERRTRG